LTSSSSALLSLQELEQLPGYVQDLVEFRLLLFAAKGLPSFSTRVAVSQSHSHASVQASFIHVKV
jgi:hypothetical protein